MMTCVKHWTLDSNTMSYKTTTIFTCDVCKEQQISKERRHGLGSQKGYKQAFNSLTAKEWTVSVFYDCRTATLPETVNDGYIPYRGPGVKKWEQSM